MTIEPRTLIARRYRVGPRLGEGGMAVVYQGSDLLLGRDVAIKTLRPQFAAEAALRSRFEREARAAAALSHPHIIDVYDVGEAEGAPYIVMELVRGHSLREIIAADAPFHPDDVAELLGQIGGALDYAHSRGYVHRDVKPANILVDDHGRARVADFGIAKSLADAELTEQGIGFGTAAYVSPEQAAGLMATPASDLYSAGVLAYEMLTGTLPFEAETPLGVAMRHIHDAPQAPSGRTPGLSPLIDQIVLKALAKDPTLRWSSVSAFAESLRDWRKRPNISSTKPVPASSSRSQGSLAPTIAIVLILAVALAALIWNGMRGLPDMSAETPEAEVLVPPPEVTGGIGESESNEATGPPLIVIEDDVPAIVPRQPEPQVAPTIAPAPGAGTEQGTVIVPNLVGLTVSGAIQALGPLGLRLVPSQPTFSDSVPLNAIVEQNPAPGDSVNPGAQILVSLSRGPSPFENGTGP